LKVGIDKKIYIEEVVDTVAKQRKMLLTCQFSFMFKYGELKICVRSNLIYKLKFEGICKQEAKLMIFGKGLGTSQYRVDDGCNAMFQYCVNENDGRKFLIHHT
jgi:hypothetical protein